jgi:serine protease Do
VGAAKAANGALDVGDVITSLKGEPVRDFRALARLTGGMRPGTAVEVGVLRRGEAKTVALRLGKLPDEPLRQPIPSAGPPRDEEASIAMPAFGDEEARLRCRQRFSGAMGILHSATGRRGGPF